MRLQFLFFVLISFIFLSCNETPTENNDSLYSVSGYVFSDSNPVQNAIVTIDNAVNYSAESNTEGYFSIHDVPKGEHTLAIAKTIANSSFSEKKYTVSVNNDVELSSLILPSPINIFKPVFSDNKIFCSWNASDADDFREYKLFRNKTSGIDENHGELIHVATDRDDTTFSDVNYNSLTNYYYRVYAMNDVGRLGGSNIENIITPNENLISNGDLEEIDIDNLPLNWKVWNGENIAYSTQEESYSGSSSVYLIGDSTYFNHHPFYQTINPNKFEHGKRYKLSYWLKSNEIKDNTGFYVYVRAENWDYSVMLPPQWGSSFPDWKEFTLEFNYPENLSTSNISIEFYVEKESSEFIAEYWLDKVSLIKVE